MSTERDRAAVPTGAPHPYSGYLALAPIPAGGELGSLPTRRQMGPLTIEQPGVPGNIAAIVLEVGPLPAEHEQMLVPYEPGATVFYRDGAQIVLRGYHYIQVGHVIAWEDPR